VFDTDLKCLPDESDIIWRCNSAVRVICGARVRFQRLGLSFAAQIDSFLYDWAIFVGNLSWHGFYSQWCDIIFRRIQLAFNSQL
jgi:hypothetical protein